jgi:hypothetical protein
MLRGSGIGDNATSPVAPAVRDQPPSPPMNLFAPVVAYPALACAVLLTLSNLFVPFAMMYMDQPLKLDYLWAGLCLLGAVYFIFRG